MTSFGDWMAQSMSDHLTEGWPLGPTSTMYMNGNAVYDIRRYGKPGIIASVELRPAKAELVREAVEERMREVRAEAFEEAAREADKYFERVKQEHRDEIFGRGVKHTPYTYAMLRAAMDAPNILRARAAEIRANRTGPGETIPVAYDEKIGWHKA